MLLANNKVLIWVEVVDVVVWEDGVVPGDEVVVVQEEVGMVVDTMKGMVEDMVMDMGVDMMMVMEVVMVVDMMIVMVDMVRDMVVDMVEGMMMVMGVMVVDMMKGMVVVMEGVMVVEVMVEEVVVHLREVVVELVHLEVVLVAVGVQVLEVGHLVGVVPLDEVVEVLLGVVLEVVRGVALVVVVLNNKERESLRVKVGVLQVLLAILSLKEDSTKLDLNQLHSNHWSRIVKAMVVVMTRITNGTKIHLISSGAKCLFNHFTSILIFIVWLNISEFWQSVDLASF
jgi:hypothetical protein